MRFIILIILIMIVLFTGCLQEDNNSTIIIFKNRIEHSKIAYGSIFINNEKVGTGKLNTIEREILSDKFELSYIVYVKIEKTFEFKIVRELNSYDFIEIDLSNDLIEYGIGMQ